MTAKKLLTLASMATLLMILAACDAQPAAPTTPGVSDAGTSTPGDDIPISPSDSPTVPANATMPAGMLLTFSKTGGFAGFNTTMMLQETGEYTLTERGQAPKEGKLDEAQLNEIKQQLDAVRGMTDLQEEYNSGNVADDIYRSITFSQDNALKTVTVAEVGGQGITPAPVQQLVGTLTGIVESQ